uniref:non-specific serine/threonine protein kinase n=1 Tax=Heligmosomoides polygyrus TaxID=6339 RepID=A0A183GFX1_HELPZ
LINRVFSVFANPRKLGEGVYGEVFATTYDGIATALKVILIPWFQILINRELSALFDPKAEFSTPNFIQLLKTNVVKGLYPQQFLTAWDAFDEANGSENDRPTNYASEQQLFVTMGMAMGGVDLEHYQVFSYEMERSTISLVVAEERLEFEHRDLHVGNALVLESNMILRSQGVKVHLIDFTLSRMSKEGTTIFRDLENDEELFAGDSDYQFDIYRMMRKSNQGDWLAFNPKSNCFWMHYLAMELINKRRCKKAITRKRRRDLQKIWDHLLEFDCLRELFTHDEFYDVLQRHMVVKPPTGRWRQ